MEAPVTPQTEGKNPEQPPPPPTPVSAGASGRAIASMVIGIVGIVFCLCFPALNIILGPVGLILAILEVKAIGRGETSDAGRGFAITGLVLGIINTIAGVVMLILFAIYGTALLYGILSSLRSMPRTP